MIVLLAPGSRIVSGGYLYNRHIADSLPEEQLKYLQLPIEPPSPNTLPRLGVDPEAHLLLDSLYFAHPRWVETLAKSHPGALSMLVHYLPSLEPLLPSAIAKGKHRDEEACLACCRSAVVPSHYLKSKVQQLYSTSLPITVAPPGITHTRAPRPINHSEGHESLHPREVKKAPVQLLTIANWTASKNHRFLLPVLAKLSKLPWEWSLYGHADETGALVQEFLRSAHFLGLKSRIHIGPHLSPQEVMDKMRRADLFIYPSLFESYGMVLAEALVAGLPTVANRIGGIPEVTEGNHIGRESLTGPEGQAKGVKTEVDEAKRGSGAAVLCNFEAPRGSQREWRAALADLIQNPQVRRNLEEAALERARVLPSWHSSAEIILSHLEPK